MKEMISRTLGLIVVCMVLHACGEKPPATERTPEEERATGLVEDRWPEEKAGEWYETVGPIRGANYLPTTAATTSDVWSRAQRRVSMWQPQGFASESIDREFGWARGAGYNSLRVFLDYPEWKADSDGFRQRMDAVLATAEKHGMRLGCVLLRGVSFERSGAEERIPGETDRSDWLELEEYVKDVVGRFGDDDHVLMWDMYNEPDNLPLVEAMFTWAREVQPSQPLTTGVWALFDSDMSKRIMELSDIVSFHAYDPPDGVRVKIEQTEVYGRPIVCTEFLRRQAGNTFAAVLPIFAEHEVGWYNWGLVAQKLPAFWGSQQDDSLQKVWQTDVFHSDGRPYRAEEIELIRSFTFELEQTSRN